MSAFYNENDRKAAAWLRELITAGVIAPGVVDERSITEINSSELHAYTQCHFFAGIGGWSYALRLAGCPDSEPVWTGSCPCQPFSSAGQRKGHADERHLWPAFYRLIVECRPATVFGEQVASPDGREWFAGIRADLEGAGYCVGGADLCAAGCGAPHPRQRIYWMAHATGARCLGTIERTEGETWDETRMQLPRANGEPLGMVLANGSGRNAREQAGAALGYRSSVESAGHWSRFDICYFTGADAGKARRIPRCPEPDALALDHGISGDMDAGWRESDGSIFPLAENIQGRVALLRGAGNAIVPQVAAEFIQAAKEALEWR